MFRNINPDKMQPRIDKERTMVDSKRRKREEKVRYMHLCFYEFIVSETHSEYNSVNNYQNHNS